MKHNVTIDRLRGCSVLVVVCMHYAIFFPNRFGALHAVIENGYYGVTAFFCVSGFLITSNLLRRYQQADRTDLYAFYVMRFGRIAPTLFALLLVLSLLSLTGWKEFVFPPPASLKDAVLNALTFRYNIYYLLGGSLLPAWAILWSLSIEEVFYLGYPLIAKVTRSPWWLLAILIELIVFAPLRRLGNIRSIYDYFGCFDAIAFGAVAAFAARRFSGRVPPPLSWITMLTGVAVAAGTYATFEIQEWYNPGISLVAAGAALILFASQCVPFAGTRPQPYDPIAQMGKLSYELYLFHTGIFALLSRWALPGLASFPWLLFIGAMSCVVAVSAVVHRFYAEPLNQWLRRQLLSWRPTRQAGVPPVSGPAAGPGWFTGKGMPATVSLALLLAPATYAVRDISPVRRLALTLLYASGVWQGEMPEVVIINPQGNDKSEGRNWYWIGPDATVEINAEYTRVRRVALTFDVTAGPSNPDPARGLVLRDSTGKEQRFDFSGNGKARFDLQLQRGSNVFTLRVAYPLEATVFLADPRKFMVQIEHPALVALP